MAADVRGFYQKICGHCGHFGPADTCGHTSGHQRTPADKSAAMSADLSSGVPWCPLVSAGVSAGVRRSKMSAVSADFVKKTGDICGHVLECRGSLINSKQKSIIHLFNKLLKKIEIELWLFKMLEKNKIVWDPLLRGINFNNNLTLIILFSY